MNKNLTLLVGCFIIISNIGLKAENLPENIKSYLKIENPSNEEGNEFYDNVTKWAEKEPEAATKWAYTLQRERGLKDSTASGAVLGVVRAISKQGPKKTFEWIKANLKDEEERLGTICDLVVVEAFPNIPVIEIAEAGNSTFARNSSENIYVAQNFFFKVPPEQEDQVLQYGSPISDPEGLYKSAILGPTIDNIAKRDFPRASSIWSSLNEGSAKNLIYAESIEKYLLQMRPEQAVEWLQTHQISEFQKSVTEGKIFNDWYLSDKEGATQYFIERMRQSKPSVFPFIFAVEKNSPIEALELLAKIENKNDRDTNLEIYAHQLYKKNKQQFQEIYKDNTNFEISVALRTTLFNIYSSEDPKKACLYYLELTQKEKDSLKVLFLLSCGNWYEKDSKGFMLWARTLRKDEYDPIISYLQVTSKKFIADENVKHVSEEMPLGQKRDKTLDQIVQTMAMENPKNAAAWALGLKNNEEKNRAIQKTLLIWSVKNPADACDWIVENIQEYPEELEPSLLGPFVLLGNKDRKAALEKGKQIQNIKLRQLVVVAIQVMKS